MHFVAQQWQCTSRRSCGREFHLRGLLLCRSTITIEKAVGQIGNLSYRLCLKGLNGAVHKGTALLFLELLCGTNWQFVLPALFKGTEWSGA